MASVIQALGVWFSTQALQAAATSPAIDLKLRLASCSS